MAQCVKEAKQGVCGQTHTHTFVQTPCPDSTSFLHIF